MPPEDRLVPRFAAEPPHEHAPTGRWADSLREAFLAAAELAELDEGQELGEIGEISWFPDRTWNGRVYLPATAPSSTGLELFGYLSWEKPGESEPQVSESRASATAETAADNPEWQVDLCEEVVGSWRGETGKEAKMTLVWGRPMVRGAAIATGELAGLCVDQCELSEDGLFTLLAPDDYRGDTLEIGCFDARSREVARESLYEED
jgi:hypothetical protein